MKNLINVPFFSSKEVSKVMFGGFDIDRFMLSGPDKLPIRNKTLPEAMIIAADKGKGYHLLTAFEWSSLAYLWKKAKSLDECAYDLHAETWQWVMGLFMESDGSVDVLGSLDVTYQGSPYGRGTIDNSDIVPTLICDGKKENWLKKWSPGAFDGMKLYIAETEKFFPIIKTSENSIALSSKTKVKKGSATFCIVRHVETDVTSGMNSGNRISSLRNSDPDLKAFAIPATSNILGTPDFGNDSFWFRKSAGMRAAIRGGSFSSAAYAGVFALYLCLAPSLSTCGVGFRAAKAL